MENTSQDVLKKENTEGNKVTKKKVLNAFENASNEQSSSSVNPKISKRVKIRLVGETKSQWFNITSDDFNEFLNQVSSRLGAKVTNVSDREGIQFVDLKTIQENEDLYFSYQESSALIQEPRTPSPFNSFAKILLRNSLSPVKGKFTIMHPSERVISQILNEDFTDKIFDAAEEFFKVFNETEGWKKTIQVQDCFGSYKKLEETSSFYAIRGTVEINAPPNCVLSLVPSLEENFEPKIEDFIKEAPIIERISHYVWIAHRIYQTRICFTKFTRDVITISATVEISDGSLLQLFIPLDKPHPVARDLKDSIPVQIKTSGIISQPKMGVPDCCLLSVLQQFDTSSFPTQLFTLVVEKYPLGPRTTHRFKKEVLKCLQKNSPNNENSFRKLSFKKSQSNIGKIDLPEVEEKQASKYKPRIINDEIQTEALIGSGSSGDVYKGKWRGIDCAIKVLKKDSVDNHQEFEREANLMCYLRNHPNVVIFYGTSLTPLSIITEYCSNGSLYSYLQKNATLNTNTTINIIMGVLNGMVHLQEENIVHRDLACRNILLDDKLNPKISDFGLSRLLKNNLTVGKTDCDAGPIRHMAPENILAREYSEKSDVWSFGVVLYEIITKEIPYKHLIQTQVAIYVISGQAKLEFTPAQKEKWPQIADVMEMCFQFKSNERPTFKQIQSFLQLKFSKQ